MIEDLEKIEQQIADLNQQRAAILATVRADDLKIAKGLIAKHRFTANELGLDRVGAVRATAGRRPPKYRNPANADQTWAGGKGVKPKWVREYVDNGGRLDDLLITKA